MRAAPATGSRRLRTLRQAAVLSLVGLSLMVWSVIAPAPLSVMIAMTAGQAVGTLSFVLYVAVVATDLLRRGALEREDDGVAK